MRASIALRTMFGVPGQTLLHRRGGMFTLQARIVSCRFHVLPREMVVIKEVFFVH